jgi:hypothetical protein
VTMLRASSPTDRRSSSARRAGVTRAVVLRVALAAVLGVLAALLVACSGSGKGLIPTGDAGPLQSDFEAVEQAAKNGGGNCASTESALLKTDQAFAALPATIDTGLHNTLRQGIENLRTQALALCSQPLPQTTQTTTTPKTTSTTTATTPPETQTTQTTATTPPPSPSGPGGGTPAPGEEGGEEEGLGKGKGEGGGKGHNGRGNSGGTQPEAGGQGATK